MNGNCLGLVDLQLIAQRGSNVQRLRTAGSRFPRLLGEFFLLLHMRPWLGTIDSYIRCLKICRKKGATLTCLYSRVRRLSQHRVNGLPSRVTVRCRHSARLSAPDLEDWSRGNGIVTVNKGNKASSASHHCPQTPPRPNMWGCTPPRLTAGLGP